MVAGAVDDVHLRRPLPRGGGQAPPAAHRLLIDRLHQKEIYDAASLSAGVLRRRALVLGARVALGGQPGAVAAGAPSHLPRLRARLPLETQVVSLLFLF